MKLSASTLAVLKNFQTINSGIVVVPGKLQRTVNAAKSVFANVELDEDFQKEFGIYDISKLLTVLGLYDNPELELEDNAVLITNGRARTRIRYSDISVILRPEKNIKMPPADVEVSLDEKDLKFIEQIGSVLKCPYVVFENRDGEDIISAMDVKNEIVDVANLSLGKSKVDKPYRLVLKCENLKLLDGSYDVSLSARGISKFQHKKLKLEYYIAVESSHSYFGAPKA